MSVEERDKAEKFGCAACTMEKRDLGLTCSREATPSRPGDGANEGGAFGRLREVRTRCESGRANVGFHAFRGGNAGSCQATEGMDGTQKYVWSSGLSGRRGRIFFRLSGCESNGGRRAGSRERPETCSLGALTRPRSPPSGRERDPARLVAGRNPSFSLFREIASQPLTGPPRVQSEASGLVQIRHVSSSSSAHAARSTSVPVAEAAIRATSLSAAARPARRRRHGGATPRRGVVAIRRRRAYRAAVG